MAADIRDNTRYRSTVARYRAMVEPGVGTPSSFEAAELSPDGRLVAVVCRIVDALEGRGRTELRLVPVDGSPASTITQRDGDASGPRWSPDGGQLAYLADHGDRHRAVPWVVPVVDSRRSGEPRRLAAPPGIAEQVRWSPDGTRLLLVMAGEQAEQADGLGSGTVGQDLGADTPSWYPDVATTEGDDEWRSAWTVDLATGAVERRSPVGLNVWEADWIGNDAAVAVVSDAAAEDAWYHARLVRLGPAAGEVATLHAPDWQIQFAEGSPDGRRAVVIEGVASDRYYTAGDVVVVEADGSGSRSLGWVGADVGAVRWDGPNRLVALGTDGMETVLFALDPDGATPTELYRADVEPAGAWTQLSAVGDRVALALTGASEPDRVAVVEGGKAVDLLGTDHGGRDLVRAAIASKRVETWVAADGTRIQGVLLLPHGEPPFASILWVHGGPVGAVGMGFEPPVIALLVEAGYAVLVPNPRGSTGRGRAFAAAVVGDMGGEDARDLLAAADHLVASGTADAARLVVAGVSYGGYMAAYLPSIDPRFAAAVVGSPLTDLVSSYYGSSLTAFVHDFVGGRPEADITRYVARSAVFAGPSLRTPSLISVGLRDRATPSGQAVELFRALRDQGVAAELLLYPEEGHGVRAIEARMDWVARILVWLDRYAPARA